MALLYVVIWGGLVEIVIVSVKLLPANKMDRENRQNPCWAHIIFYDAKIHSTSSSSSLLSHWQPQNQTNTFYSNPQHHLNFLSRLHTRVSGWSEGKGKINLENRNTFWPTIIRRLSRHEDESFLFAWLRTDRLSRIHWSALHTNYATEKRGFPFLRSHKLLCCSAILLLV